MSDLESQPDHEPQHYLHVGAALADAGWYPGAWRSENARPTELLTARYWTDLAALAQHALLDFVTIEDGLGLQRDDPLTPDRRTDRVRGRLDAVLLANRIAPATRAIGIIPVATTTHTEPFHTSKAIATLDFVSSGRAGVALRVNGSAADAKLFGRRSLPEFTVAEPDPAVIHSLFSEAADYAEVLRRLWDSWEDDAEIRDIVTGRFVDREKLHYIDFEGEHFSVRGPSITPRPPQGQPIIAALGHRSVPYELIGRVADLGFITPHDHAEAVSITSEIDGARRSAGRHDAVRVVADILVVLADTESQARARKEQLDEWAGAELHSDAEIFVGTPTGLVDRIEELAPRDHEPSISGVRLRPAVLPDDLGALAGVTEELAARGRFRTAYATDTLRGHLGLARPANRYAA